jgi:hypothetical protein
LESNDVNTNEGADCVANTIAVVDANERTHFGAHSFADAIADGIAYTSAHF